MKFDWNSAKNLKLGKERAITFEQVVFHIERGNLLDIIEHPNHSKYPNQKIFIVNIDNYAYLVPFIEDAETVFLKTIIPSRKITKLYAGGGQP